MLCFSGGDPVSELGKRLRERRVALGLTQDELAARLFVTRQTISNYERGLSEPYLDTLRRLAEALETDIVALLGTEPSSRKVPQKKEILLFLLGVGLTAGAAAWFFISEKQAFAWKSSHYDVLPYMRAGLFLLPLVYLLLGWTLMQGAACLTELPALQPRLRVGLRFAVLALILVYLLASAPALLPLPLTGRIGLEAELVFARAARLGIGWGKYLALLFGSVLRLSRRNKGLTRGQDMI